MCVRLFFNTAATRPLKTFTRASSQCVQKILTSPVPTEKVEIKGWVKSLRKLKELIFFDVSDGLSPQKLQVTIPATAKPEKLNVGASVVVKGFLGKAPSGQFELNAEEISVCGGCPLTEGYPFLPRKTYSAEYIREYLHLRPKTNKFASLLRVRSQAASAINEHFKSEGYTNIHTPILTSNDCEGAGEIFKVLPESESILKTMKKANKSNDEAYFDRKTYLTVSGQLHLEAAALALNKVYTFGPTFRAENSKSRLHLSEFYMVEAEIAFTSSIEDLIVCTEKLLKESTEKVINTCADDIEISREEVVNYDWISRKFPVLTYDEAREILEKHFKMKIPDGADFTKEQELLLVKHCGDLPTFIINFPKQIKPFYMRTCADNENRVSAFDLLAPNVGELVGGSLREDSYEKLQEKLPSEKGLQWYLELRKFGGCPTGGYGLGFERYLQFLLGVNNIKDTIPFPRWPHNCSL